MISIYNLNDLKNNDTELDNYYYYKNAFNEDEINKILKTSEKLPFQKAIAGGKINKSYRSSEIKWLPNNKEFKWLYDKISTLIKKANNNCWNFDIIGFGENIQLGEYKAENKGHYDWHMDMGKRCPHRKISASILLSDIDEYTGGDLEFKFGRDSITAPRLKGSMIIFPSYCLHRVTPVTSGIRKSIVIWISGPSFR